MTSLLWVPVALIASLAQTARNATQASLTRAIGTVGATQVRFLFGLPFAIAFLALARLILAEPLPSLTLASVGFTLMGAVAQIAATALMLITMKDHSFAVTTAWIKTEPILVAIGAALVLADPLSWPQFAAIAIATVGVVLLSLKKGVLGQMGLRPLILGLAAAGLFGLSAIGFRGGITALETGGFLIRASMILVLALSLQTLILLIWMAFRDRRALGASFAVWRSSLGAGFLGAFASQFWFLGFALTSAANVRTLALIEVPIALLIARFKFGQSTTSRQNIGLVLMIFGVGLMLRLHA